VCAPDSQLAGNIRLPSIPCHTPTPLPKIYSRAARAAFSCCALAFATASIKRVCAALLFVVGGYCQRSCQGGGCGKTKKGPAFCSSAVGG
jgi:hypothetical protein